MSPPHDDSTLPPPEPPSQATSDFIPTTDPPATLAPPSPHAGPVAVTGYEVVGELGRGGMGVVYHAVQVRLHRPAALKMILAGPHAEPKDLIRFLSEAEAVAAIKHPHVVDVYEFGEADGRPYFAMEYLPGGSLADRLRAGGPLPPADAAELVRRIALGVQAAHDLGIVHRDLKPQNVLFDAKGNPKVTDFGLAKRGSHDLTRTGAVMGTPAYMAPEQARGLTKFVGPAADVYALGVILYECLTGLPPFRAVDTVALIMKVAEEDPDPVRRHAPAVPRDLERVCQKCLRKDPRERYPSAAALADDLGRVLAGEPPRDVSTGRFHRILTTLGRGRQAADLTRYANLFLVCAAVLLVTHSLTGVVALGALPGWVGTAAFVTRVVGIPALLVVTLRGRLWPEGKSELTLWSVWGGYLAACLLTGAIQKYQESTGQTVGSVYPVFTVLTALAFFSLAPTFWGWCYVFGGLFLLLPVPMAAEPRAAPFLFGGCWAVVLVTMSLHLRRLAALAAPRPAG